MIAGIFLGLLVGLFSPRFVSAHPVDEVSLVLTPEIMETEQRFKGQLTMSWGQAFYLVEQESNSEVEEMSEGGDFVDYVSETLAKSEGELIRGINKDLELSVKGATCAGELMLPEEQSKELVLGSRRVVVNVGYKCEKGDVTIKNDLLMEEYPWQHNRVVINGLEFRKFSKLLSKDEVEFVVSEEELLGLMEEVEVESGVPWVRYGVMGVGVVGFLWVVGKSVMRS